MASDEHRKNTPNEHRKDDPAKAPTHPRAQMLQQLMDDWGRDDASELQRLRQYLADAEHHLVNDPQARLSWHAMLTDPRATERRSAQSPPSHIALPALDPLRFETEQANEEAMALVQTWVNDFVLKVALVPPKGRTAPERYLLIPTFGNLPVLGQWGMTMWTFRPQPMRLQRGSITFTTTREERRVDIRHVNQGDIMEPPSLAFAHANLQQARSNHGFDPEAAVEWWTEEDQVRVDRARSRREIGSEQVRWR